MADRRACCCGGGDIPGPQPSFCDLPECIRVNLSGIIARQFSACVGLMRQCSPTCIEGPGPHSPSYLEEVVDRYFEDKARVFSGFTGIFELPRVMAGLGVAEYEATFPARWFQWLYTQCEDCNPASMTIAEAHNAGLIPEAADGIRIWVRIECTDGEPEATIQAHATQSPGLQAIFDNELAEVLVFNGGASTVVDESFVVESTLPSPVITGYTVEGEGGDPGRPCAMVPQGPDGTPSESPVGLGTATITVPVACGKFPLRPSYVFARCDGEDGYVFLDWLDSPPGTLTAIVDDVRYVNTGFPAYVPPMACTWSPDLCPTEPDPGKTLLKLVRCRNSGVALGAPSELAYIPNPSIGAGNGGAVWAWTEDFSGIPGTPCLGRRCAFSVAYRATLEPASPGATVAAHRAGEPCSQPDTVRCFNTGCPPDVLPRPIIDPCDSILPPWWCVESSELMGMAAPEGGDRQAEAIRRQAAHLAAPLARQRQAANCRGCGDQGLEGLL